MNSDANRPLERTKKTNHSFPRSEAALEWRASTDYLWQSAAELVSSVSSFVSKSTETPITLDPAHALALALWSEATVKGDWIQFKNLKRFIRCHSKLFSIFHSRWRSKTWSTEEEWFLSDARTGYIIFTWFSSLRITWAISATRTCTFIILPKSTLNLLFC